MKETESRGISRCPKYGDHVLRKALWEPREKAAHSAWGSASTPSEVEDAFPSVEQRS